MNGFTLWLNTLLVGGMLCLAPEIRGGPQSSATGKTAFALEPGKAIERAMAGGEIHEYKVSLEAGQFLHVTVDQRGIDLMVTVLGPDGKRIAEVDSPNGDNGPEPVEVVATATGDYRVEIRPLEKAANRGRYQVKVEELLTADQYAGRLA